MNMLQDITQQPSAKSPILRIWRELNARNQEDEASTTSLTDSKDETQENDSN